MLNSESIAKLREKITNIQSQSNSKPFDLINIETLEAINLCEVEILTSELDVMIACKKLADLLKPEAI